MKQSAHLFPRSIDPSLIEVGDSIRVTHKENDGMVMTLSGKVAKRYDHGDTRYLLTAEGGTLLAWNVKRKYVTVLLLDRPPVEQTPLSLFDYDEFRDRIAI